MKWFQHDANASHDAKMKKLILRHGAEGYAVYFHCLELIAGDLSQTNITFELEHDAEIIADNLKIEGDTQTAGIDKVNAILRTIINLGLFTEHDQRVFCFKMANRLDNTVSRSPEINKIKQLRSDYVEATKTYKAEDNTIQYNKIDHNTKEDNKDDNYFTLFKGTSLDNSKFRETWLEWVSFRKTEMKKKLTPTAAKKQAKLLCQYDVPTAVQMLDKSMNGNYLGVFPLNDKKQPKKSEQSMQAGYCPKDLKPMNAMYGGK